MNAETASQHDICIYSRKRAEMSGILEVESFQDTAIDLLCDFGSLSVEGEALKIDSFSVETGRITISGTITGLYYYEKAKPGKGGLFARRQK